MAGKTWVQQLSGPSAWRIGMKMFGLILVLTVMTAVAAGRTTESVGPYLDSLSGWQRAALGVLAGALLAAPTLLLLIRRLGRRLAWPLGMYALFAGFYLIATFSAGKRARYKDYLDEHRLEIARYREQADWFLVTESLTYVLALVGVVYLLVRLRANRR